jgi:methyl-accepting chemotaxis protein
VPTHGVAGDHRDAGSGLLIGLLSLWLINRNLVEPIRKLIDYVAQLSHGKFAERVASARQD